MTHHKPIVPPAFVFNKKLMPIIKQFGIPHDVKAVTDVSMSLMANKVHEIHFDRPVPVLLQTRKTSIRAVLETTWFEDDEIVWHKYKVEGDNCFEFDIIIDRSINQFTAEMIFPFNEKNIPLINQLVSCFHNKGEKFLISEVTEQGTLRQIIDFSTVQSVSGLGKRVLVK
jgi:hypothetical protein